MGESWFSICQSEAWVHCIMPTVEFDGGGMNYNRDCEPGPFVQQHCVTFTKGLLDEWAKIPTGTLKNLVKRLPRRLEAVIAAKKGTNSMALEWDVGKSPVGVVK